MKHINLDSSSYNRKEDLKTFLDSVNGLIDKFNKDFANADSELNKTVKDINKKETAIKKIETQREELDKKLTELQELKSFSNDEIKNLEDKKKSISYTDTEVQKMELEDLDLLIASKKNKISKIDTKLSGTQEKISANKLSLKTANIELENLEMSKRNIEESFYRTQNITDVVNALREELNSKVSDIITMDVILESDKKEEVVIPDINEEKNSNKDMLTYDDLVIPFNPEIEYESMDDDFSPIVDDNDFEMEDDFYPLLDEPSVDHDYNHDDVVSYVDNKDETIDSRNDEIVTLEALPGEEIIIPDEEDEIIIEDVDSSIDEPTIDDEPIIDEMPELESQDIIYEPLNDDVNENSEEVVVENQIENPYAFDNLDLNAAITDEQAQKITELEDTREPETNVNYEMLLRDIFKEETVTFDTFSDEVKQKMIENADRVMKNLAVLKKHQIPLELTAKQADIYFGQEPQDLDDLLAIITVDSEGNGMGYTIDYAFYILNELSKIDVDRLIEVYNREFMNINSKSGLIGLLKQTNPELVDFKENRRQNMDILNSLGVIKTDEIASKYPEFINIDNPLFLNVLNLFDKDDLIEKLNDDDSIIPKILDYWQNN